jgi:hypothetical protein
MKLYSLQLNLNVFYKGLEVCAVKLHFLSISFCISSIYRSPIGNLLYCLKALESVLISLYSNTIEFIICGDIKINYFNYNGKRKQLDSLLSSFNLCSTIQSPTRICNNYTSAIDNIFIDKVKN